MAQRGTGNVATDYLATGLQILFFLAISMFLIQVFAGLLGSIQQHFPVSSSNPMYNMTQTWQSVTNQVSGLIPALVMVGIAIAIIAGVYVLWAGFHRA